MRTFITAAIFSFFFSAFCSPLAAQHNPMPFVNNPLVPAAVAPGGPGFTLTVNGAGFVSGAAVLWNGSPRVTTFVSQTKLTAQILAPDIAAAAVIFVTVANPGSDSGVLSDPVLFEVTTPVTSLAFNRTDNSFIVNGGSSLVQPVAMVAGDLFGDNLSSLAIANSRCPVSDNCILSSSSVTLVLDGDSVGNEDLIDVVPNGIVTGGPYTIISGGSIAGPTRCESLLAVFPNAGGQGKYTSIPEDAFVVATGDFNRDGNVDVVMGSDINDAVYVLLGNGDGTFRAAASFTTGSIDGHAVVGDFNGDGILDLAVANPMSNTISMLLGNGDGTFQSHVDFSAAASLGKIMTADFNGDGKLDLAALENNAISIFLGNGDGTFQPRVDYSTGNPVQAVAIGDYNGDGVLDLVASNLLCTGSNCSANGSVSILLGNGDGTFQSHLDLASGGTGVSIVSGAFGLSTNPVVGRQEFATLNNTNGAASVSIFLPAPSAGSGNPIPVISSISPTSVQEGSGSLTLTVNGTNFLSGSIVNFGGQARPTTFVSSTQLAASILASDVDVAAPETFSITVVNPSPGGGASNVIAFSVNLPPPTISSINPSSVVAGGPAFTLTVNGSNFVTGATVNFNGTPRPATFVSVTQLTVSISATDIMSQGTINISVTVPAGNGSVGGTTSSLPLTVLPTNTQPVVGALSPASITAGSSAFTLTLTGTGFTSNSIVTFNSSVVFSLFVSATQLQASIPAAAVATAGTPLVTVANPGGTPSVVVSFTVNNPVPGASSLSPSSVPAGNAAITLSVVGTNFNTSSMVLVGGASRATTYLSSTSLSAALPLSDFAHSGTLSVTVNNPAPGGGTTSALVITVEDFNVNVQTPATSVPAGQSANFNLMVVLANTTTANSVTFAVTSMLPAGATASFAPSATIPADSRTTPVTLSIATTPHSAASAVKSPRAPYINWPVPYLTGLAIMFMWLGLRILNGRARLFAPQFLLVSLLIVAAALLACGGGPSGSGVSVNPSTGTPAGTYPIVVTATSGNGSLSNTVMLTVM